jgi:hypothetical protein
MRPAAGAHVLKTRQNNRSDGIEIANDRSGPMKCPGDAQQLSAIQKLAV